MNLTSCDSCGVVLDKKKLQFPDLRNEDGSYDLKKCQWTGNGFAPIVPCPVCKEPILSDVEVL